MFDLATRPTPATVRPAAALATPFDLRLTQPSAPTPHPYTDYCNATGAPQAGVETLAVYAVELEDTLATAVVLSLFTDRRAGRDDALPRGETQRRGWVGEEFVSPVADAWGSGLWLLYTGKVTADVLERARFAAQEALAWLVRDGIASRVVVTAEWAGPQADRLALRPQIYKPDQVRPVYDVLWGTSIQRWAAA